jgi:hypothetical protein
MFPILRSTNWRAPVFESGKEIQNSNGKGQMANGKPFEICLLPFAI